jgi:hypothetical protein
MCLITATIAVPEGTAVKLAARPGFDLDIDEPDRVTWWGRADPGRPRRYPVPWVVVARLDQ